MKKLDFKQGFTLLELLMVLVIIGLLAGLIVVGLTDGPRRARDAKREADLNGLKKAIESYYQDHGYYPPSSCGWDCGGYWLSNDGWGQLARDLAPYLGKDDMPTDTKQSENCGPWQDDCFAYAYGNVGRTLGRTYDLIAQYESTKNPKRCEKKNYYLGFTDTSWCQAHGGDYSNQLYDAGYDFKTGYHYDEIPGGGTPPPPPPPGFVPCPNILDGGIEYPNPCDYLKKVEDN